MCPVLSFRFIFLRIFLFCLCSAIVSFIKLNRISFASENTYFYRMRICIFINSELWTLFLSLFRSVPFLCSFATCIDIKLYLSHIFHPYFLFLLSLSMNTEHTAMLSWIKRMRMKCGRLLALCILMYYIHHSPISVFRFISCICNISIHLQT